MESNFDLLLENYLELETACLSIAAEAMVRQHRDYEDFFLSLSTPNRRVVNLLTAARLYVDQLPRTASACGLDPATVTTSLNSKYGADFEYRFMEALRNHVQHRGSAVHKVAFEPKWVPPDRRERSEYSVFVAASRQRLEEDGGFKSQVLSECPNEIDVLYASRVYLQSLGEVHSECRRLLAEGVAEARRVTKHAIDRYHSHSLESDACNEGLTAFGTDGEAEPVAVPVFLNWDNVRERLIQKNGDLANLRRRYVSTYRAHDAQQVAPKDN